jgi:hypothetical protein
MPSPDKTVKAERDRAHYLKTSEERLAYRRAYSREYKRKMREALGIKRRALRVVTTKDEWRMLKSSQEAARYARAMAFDPAGTLPLLREFMTAPIIHPPRPPQESAYAQVVSRSSNSRMETQAQRAGQRQATCA